MNINTPVSKLILFIHCDVYTHSVHACSLTHTHSPLEVDQKLLACKWFSE